MNPEDIEFVIDEPAPGWVSVSALQCRLRELFATKPTHRAVAVALQEIGALLDADYAVMHARVGFQPVSEEWSRSDFALREGLREQVNAAMLAALESDEPRCIRIPGSSNDIAVAAAVIYGSDAEQAGSVALVFRDCTRAHAYELMAQLESLVGFLALLLSGGQPTARNGPDPEMLGTAEAVQPLRLLLQLVTDLSARYELDQVSIGLVEGQRVRVALVNNELDLRPSNPGVRRIQDAMSECLDVQGPICVGKEAQGPEFRLHSSWKASRGSGIVGSVPLVLDGKVIAIVSLASSHEATLTNEKLLEIQKELTDYAYLLPMARLATRSLVRHTRDSTQALWRRMTRGRLRFTVLCALLTTAFCWLAFGSLQYRLTVPCEVAAMNPRVVSCPRDGVLTELYVRPGDQVTRGQLLAELDSHDDGLTRAELETEVRSIEAQMDVARGEFDSGKLRVLEAQREGLLAKIDVVSKRIDMARIKAPSDGVILVGELREKLGARIAMGEQLFEMARYDGARVRMRIPEKQIMDARQAEVLHFVASADPDRSFMLRAFRVAPASVVQDGDNVFVAEADVAETIEGLPPGVEGFVILDLGPRRASWVLTHRIVDWVHLNFWL